MNPSRPFIMRPVATALLMVAIVLGGLVGFRLLPLSALPQVNLGESLDVAEQEVQAAINAGSNLLPADLPAPPVYAKVNPADAPVLTLGLVSKTLPLPQVQNLA